MSIKLDLYHVSSVVAWFSTWTSNLLEEASHNALFYCFYYGSTSGPLLLHEHHSGGVIELCQRAPGGKMSEWGEVVVTGLVLVWVFKGSGGQWGSQNMGVGGKMMSVEAFLLLFSHTDISNRRSLLSNIAGLYLWCEEELSASSVRSPSITLWTQLCQRKWRLILLTYFVSIEEVRIGHLALRRVFLIVC